MKWLLILVFLLVACGRSAEETKALVLESADQGKLEVLSGLLNESNVDVRDHCQFTPLMKASLNGHVDIVDHLLTQGADPNLTDKGGYSALMFAASKNHTGIIQRLLDHGAKIDGVENTGGWTALIWAVKNGNANAVRFLIDNKADKGIHDLSGKTAKDWAIERNDKAIIPLL